MTVILWHKNRLYADSAVIKGTERYQSLTKIHALRTPLQITSDDPAHCDTILGWVASGAIEAARGFMAMLAARPKLNMAVMIYDMIGKHNLITQENYFEVILIGTKANYSIAPEMDKCEVKIYRHDQCWGMGTGGPIAVDYVMDDGFTPIRAMYGALYRDRLSGGMIDVWELTTGKKPVFQRIGLCNELPYDDILAVLTKPTVTYPLDLIDQRLMLSDLLKEPRADARRARKAIPSTKPKASPARKGKKS